MSLTVAQLKQQMEEAIRRLIANGTDPKIARFSVEVEYEALLRNAETAERAARDVSGGTQGNKAPPASPGVSAGQVVNDSKDARGQGKTQSPPINPQPQAQTTNTDPNTTDQRNTGDITNQSQGAASIASGGTAADALQQPDNNISDLARSTSRTVNEDSPEINPTKASSFNNGKVLIPNEFIEPVKVRDNPLDEFVTSTYTASLYLMSPGDYRNIVLASKGDNFRGELLMQTGGAPYSIQEQGTTRNRFFDVDFYMDDIELKSYVTGTSTSAAHNIAEVRFTISEPNGISFFDRLKAAVQAANPDVVNMNYAAQQYLLVLRFFGYDENGNLKEFPPVEQVDPETGETTVLESRGYYIEKFVPIKFRSITFTVEENVTVYRCEAAPLPYDVGYSTKLASIPFNMEIQGGTLKEILDGATETVVEDPSNTEGEALVNAADTSLVNSERYITRGLFKALNDAETAYAAKNNFLPNQYKIEFVSGFGIESASVVPPGNSDKGTRPMSKPSSQNVDPAKGKVENTKRKFSIAAGTQIVQVLQNLVQRSTYIINQQKVNVDPVTGKVDKNQKVADSINSDNPPLTQWFKISSFVRPLQYDENRNDFVYEIRYVISPYALSKVDSAYFPDSRQVYPHKAYSYWFTGENTNILNFKQDFNYLYFTSVTDNSGTAGFRRQPAGTHLAMNSPKVNSTENSQGLNTQVYEPASNLASALYSPADLALTEVDIIGDPDFIQQNEILYNSRYDVQTQSLQAWLPDGSINYGSRDVVFQIKYKTPADYNEQGDGLMSDQRFSSKEFSGNQQNRENSFLYRLNVVSSYFRRGEFTQRIEGTLIIDKPVVPTVSPATRQGYGVDTGVYDDAALRGIRTGRSTGNPGVGVQGDSKVGPTGARPDPVNRYTGDYEYEATNPEETTALAEKTPGGPVEPINNTGPTDATTGQSVTPITNVSDAPISQEDYDNLRRGREQIKNIEKERLAQSGEDISKALEPVPSNEPTNLTSIEETLGIGNRSQTGVTMISGDGRQVSNKPLPTPQTVKDDTE